MRQRIMVTLTVLLFALTGGLLGQPNQCDLNPTLFPDDSLRGRGLSLTTSINDLHSVGFGDSASSLCVPAGWRITVYEDTGYRGNILELVGPIVINDLKRDRPQGSDWGDRISSVQVTRLQTGRADCDDYPVIYADDGYGGRRYEVRDSIRDLHGVGMGDSVSSVCVPQGWRVVFFEHTNHGGQSFTIDGYQDINDLKRDRPGGTDWGDRISSVRVERTSRANRGRNPSTPSRRPNRGDTTPTIRCDYPTFYLDSGFGGRTLVVESSITDLHSRGFGDRISSVCIPAGWNLSLYSEPNYRGNRLVIQGSQVLADLAYDSPDRRNWSDQISSIQVEASGRFNPLPGIRLPGDPGVEPVRCTVPVLYSDDGFSGRTLEVTQSISDLHVSGFGDEASSVCVPTGWEIVLYSETNFRGSSVTVTSGQEIRDLRRDRPGGQDWGDIASSVRITRTGRR